ncbi:HEAT repeat domain-containing protein [Lentzea sp. NPDC058450]|uniref:HEAT repeat domain-containing protein n=1 Tax=Lentzea sp. NPDC058450 TaxID=3346505 RepID=UPI0036478807
MRTAEEILRDTRWDELGHAYGSAADAPRPLLDLLSEDEEACGNALGYLDAAVLHQGSVYSSTAPAAEYVASILGDPRVSLPCESALPWDDRERPLRAALLEWLGAFAESVTYDQESFGDEFDEEFDDEEEAAVRAGRALLPDLFGQVVPFLDDADAAVRQAATGAVARLLGAAELAGHRAGVAERLLSAAREASPLERAGIALTLGGWGVPVLLDDEHPGVRAYAAIATAYDDDPAALAEVRAALRDPAAADDLLGGRPPQLDMMLRFHLVAALLRRTTTFDEIADEAVAIARMTNAYTVDSDWGPLLVRAFPSGPADALTAAQHRFLAALVTNDECWGSIANPKGWLRKAGLPTERDALRELL